MLTVYINGSTHTISKTALVISFAIVMAIVVAFYVLRSLGIFVIAKRKNFRYAYVSWIPLAWVYVLGKICGEVTFFGKRIKKFAVFLTIVFSITQIISFIYSFMYFLPLVGYFLSGGEVFYILSSSGTVSLPVIGYFGDPHSPIKVVASEFIYVYNGSAELPINIVNFLNILGYFSDFFDIIEIVFLVLAYKEVFKKYLPNRYFIATFCSIIGLFAPFIFAVRKNKEVNYQEYMRARYEAMYRSRYGANGGFGGYNNQSQNTNEPFGQYSQNQNSSQAQAGEPFEDFTNKSSDPFDEFDDKKGDK